MDLPAEGAPDRDLPAGPLPLPEVVRLPEADRDDLVPDEALDPALPEEAPLPDDFPFKEERELLPALALVVF